MVDCTFEAGAFECVYRENMGVTERFYGYAGYFRFDENGDCVDYWRSSSIVTLDTATKMVYNVWWPGDGAAYEDDIYNKFPAEIAKIVAEPDEDRAIIILERLLAIAKARMIPETSQDVLDRLSLLTAEDIRYISGSISKPDTTELARLINRAMAHPIESEAPGLFQWTLDIYLSGGPDSYDPQKDEWLSISAPLEIKNILVFRYHSEDGQYTTLYCEDEALYQFIDGLYRAETALSSEELAEFTAYFNTPEHNGLLRFPCNDVKVNPETLQPYLKLLFYDIGEHDSTISDEEFALLAQKGINPITDTFRLKRSFINDYLLAHFDLSAEVSEKLLASAKLGTYLAEYDAWYLVHGDTAHMPYQFDRGEQYADGTLRLYYVNPFLTVLTENGSSEHFYEGVSMAVTLTRQNGDWVILSNEEVPVE